MDELINSDEMVELMAPDDRHEVKEEVKRHSRDSNARGEYSKTWHAEKVRVEGAAAKAKAAAAAKGKGKAKAKAVPRRSVAWKGPRDFPKDVPPQAEVKHLVPPGASIWRRNLVHAWGGRLLPHPRISRAWQLYGGHYNALRLVCQSLWQEYLFANGFTQADCPIAGVFD